MRVVDWVGFSMVAVLILVVLAVIVAEVMNR